MKALSRDYDITRRMSEATVIIEVQDTNDNSPTFQEKQYKISVPESEQPAKVILTVKAVDLDSTNTPEEIKRGYGVVRYHLTGENANMFRIDAVDGNIRVSAKSNFRLIHYSTYIILVNITDYMVLITNNMFLDVSVKIKRLLFITNNMVLYDHVWS